MPNTVSVGLSVMNKQIADLTKERNNLLQELRQKCNHLRLVEIEYSCLFTNAPPRRICVDCGAEEEGWYCGYQVLVMNGDTSCNVPHQKERVLVETTSDSSKFYSYRKSGSLYLVGQNHPNFPGGGHKTYKQLTEVLE